MISTLITLLLLLTVGIVLPPLPEADWFLGIANDLNCASGINTLCPGNSINRAGTRMDTENMRKRWKQNAPP